MEGAGKAGKVGLREGISNLSSDSGMKISSRLGATAQIPRCGVQTLYHV